MTRSLWLVNVVLTVVLILLLAAITDSLVNSVRSVQDPQLAGPAPESAGQSQASEAPAVAAPPTAPPLSEYAILVQKDVFKTAVAEPVAPAAVRKPPPPPAPLPVLVGTVFVDEERKAVLRDGKRTDLFQIGEEVAGGKLVRIETDRVVIQRGEASVEVSLKASMQSVSTPGTPAPLPPPGGASTEGPSPIPSAAPAVPPASPPPQVTERGTPAGPDRAAVEERVRNLRQTLQNRRRHLPVR